MSSIRVKMVLIDKLGYLPNDEKCLDPAWVVAVSKVAGKFVLDIIVEIAVIEVKVAIEVKAGTDTETVELKALRIFPEIIKITIGFLFII